MSVVSEHRQSSASILPSSVSLYQFATHEDLFADLDPLNESWFAWNMLFKVLSDMPLNRKEKALFRKISGGLEYVRGQMPHNLLLLIGRKGGKSLKISQISQWRAMRFDPLAPGPGVRRLAPGETARNLIIAPATRTGDLTMDFVEGLFDAHAQLKSQIVRRKRTEQIGMLLLKNRCMIAQHPVTRVAGRGPSILTLILEEAAFFKTEGQFSDEEVFKAARPGLARFGKAAAWYIITTPGRKEGLVWKLFQKYYGVKNNRVLVINAPSKVFNPTLSDEFLAEEEEDDPEYYKREYLAQFVDAITAAFSAEAIDGCVIKGVPELPYSDKHDYFGLLDPAGLSESSQFNDEFTAGVAHVEDVEKGKEETIVDAGRAWTANKGAGRKVTPDIAIAESIEFFRAYGVRDVISDRFGGNWIKSKYEDAGFNYQRCPFVKWDLYLELVPATNNRTIRVVEDETAITQWKALERKRGVGTKDKINNVRGRKDDRVNIYALAQYEGSRRIGKAGKVFQKVEAAAVAEQQLVARRGHAYGAGLSWPQGHGFVAVTVIDLCCRQACLQFRAQKSGYKDQVALLKKLDSTFNLQFYNCWKDGIGGGLFKELQLEELPLRDITGRLKPAAAIEELATAFDREEIQIVPDPDLVSELGSFVAEVTSAGAIKYGMTGGGQGECVYALAAGWSGVSRAVSLADVTGGGREVRSDSDTDAMHGDDFREVL